MTLETCYVMKLSYTEIGMTFDINLFQYKTNFMY